MGEACSGSCRKAWQGHMYCSTKKRFVSPEGNQLTPGQTLLAFLKNGAKQERHETSGLFRKAMFPPAGKSAKKRVISPDHLTLVQVFRACLREGTKQEVYEIV